MSLRVYRRILLSKSSFKQLIFTLLEQLNANLHNATRNGEEPERQTVPCDNCYEIVKALKAEIISLKKRQLPRKCISKNEINSLEKLHLYP